MDIVPRRMIPVVRTQVTALRCISVQYSKGTKREVGTLEVCPAFLWHFIFTPAEVQCWDNHSIFPYVGVQRLEMKEWTMSSHWTKSKERPCNMVGNSGTASLPLRVWCFLYFALTGEWQKDVAKEVLTCSGARKIIVASKSAYSANCTVYKSASSVITHARARTRTCSGTNLKLDSLNVFSLLLLEAKTLT